MDPLTHGLTSYAIKRGFFPRGSHLAGVLVVAAGMAADMDWMSHSFGPSPFLRWHGTYLHSIVAAIAIAFGFACFSFADPPPRAHDPQQPSRPGTPFLPVFLTCFAAALAHILMDATQSYGTMLAWPLSKARIALDWIPTIDPWILAILFAAVTLPLIFRLVSSEIGARDRAPRGRNAAWIGLTLVLLCIVGRAALHSRAVHMLEPHIYGGESARRVAAYPESIWPLRWHGVVDTLSALHLVPVDAAPGAYFNPEVSMTLRKPEPSPMLDATKNTIAARKLLDVAQFPKISIDKTETGYIADLRDLRYMAAGIHTGAVRAEIELDRASKVTHEELQWDDKNPIRAPW